MANWCNNYLSVSGKDTERVLNLFRGLAFREKLTELGQTLKCFDDDRYMFNIYVEDNGWVTFETKWAPAGKSIVKIFTKYDVKGFYEYSEPGCQVLGKIVKNENGIQEYVVPQEDFDKIHYNENIESYIFEGDEYEYLSDIHELLLARLK